MLVLLAVILAATLDICMAHEPSSKLLQRITIMPDGDVDQYKDKKPSQQFFSTTSEKENLK